MDKIIKIINEISIKNVELICMEAAQKLSLWITKNKSRYQLDYCYDDELLLETIYVLPEAYQFWLEKNNFIQIKKIKKEFTRTAFTYNSILGLLVWYDNDTGKNHTIAAITKDGLTICDDIPPHAPFKLNNFEQDNNHINVNYD